MADKAAIELGKKLHSLLQDENFMPFYEEMESRIESLKVERDRWDETLDRPASFAARILHRLNELTSLRDWIHESIITGGKEKMKEEAGELTQEQIWGDNGK